jgi:DNA-binding SARP family transcriptional activator/ABC-type branched-subunit amino acid transport system substrate-binding protein/streptogramin lyase
MLLKRDVNFCVLGPLEVIDGGRRIPLAAPKQRALLALLLLARGRPVSVDRLADGLWGDEAPATAVKTVQVYVGQLRKALGEDVLVTQGGAYAVPLDRHELDMERFDRLAAEGRGLLDEGAAKRAAETLRQALGLWRGPALADFAYEEFAQAEIARLEEERLAVLEARIDADLALGRHEQLVPELTGLVREHPLRERLRGQLMTALYRAGRQAEALEAYQDGRRLLVQELGIEPGPELQAIERAVLRQDEAIAAPRGRPLAAAGRRRGARLLAAGGLVVLAAAAAAIAIQMTRGGGGIGTPVAGDSVVAVDPEGGRILAAVPVGATPSAITAGEGAIWTLNSDDRTISRIDPETKAVRTLGIGAIPTDVAAGGGGVWVGNGGKLGKAQFAGVTATAITRLDPRTGAAVGTTPLTRRGNASSNASEQHIAVAGDSVWAINPDFSVSRLDAEKAKVVVTVRGVRALGIAAGPAGIWVLTDEGEVARIDPARSAFGQRIGLAATTLTGLAVGAGSVWVTDPYDGTLWRVTPGPNPLQRTIDVGTGADSVAFGDGAVWVANSLRGTLTRVDPASNRVTRTLALGSTPRAVAVGSGAVWVAMGGGGPVTAAGERVDGVRALPPAICGRVVAGPDRPKLLLVSDLPLQGGGRFATLQMSEAVQYVLRRHGFRAGPHALAYQSCDDSTARTGLFDFTKCQSNAAAYARNTDVVGVVGPYNSGCAYAQIPVANRAGLAIVSPSNTDVGLTRKAFGAPPGLLRSLYPARSRNYARVRSQDDVQAAASAMLARRLGARRVATVDDGGYGAPFAFYFRRAAGRLGARVTASARWNPSRPKAAALGATLARSRPDAVYVCGLIDTDVGAVLRGLRAALPRSVPVMGCDGLLPLSLLFEQAGPAARGTLIAISGVTNERLPEAGRAFVRGFGATQPGGRVDNAAVYAAQAAEVMIAAIARSDGTRASISDQLLRVRMPDGLLGPVAFEASGDAVPSPVTIVRAQRGGGDDAIESHSGGRVVTVLTPPRSLVGAAP